MKYQHLDLRQKWSEIWTHISSSRGKTGSIFSSRLSRVGLRDACFLTRWQLLTLVRPQTVPGS